MIRQKGTERPGSGEYNNFLPTAGHFACRACLQPLYKAESAFNSGCGWPAFYGANGWLEPPICSAPRIAEARLACRLYPWVGRETRGHFAGHEARGDHLQQVRRPPGACFRRRGAERQLLVCHADQRGPNWCLAPTVQGFPTPTDSRHCVNSLSIKFVAADK